MSGTGRIKSFFSGLSFREKSAVISKTAMVLLVLTIMAFHLVVFDIGDGDVFFTTVVLIGAIFLLHPLFFLLFYWPVFILLMLDLHLFRAYGLSLAGFGEQATTIILNTNTAEILEYLTRLGWLEYGILASVLAASVVSLFHVPDLKMLSRKKRMLVFILLLSVYPFSFVSHFYPLIRSAGENEKNDIIAQARAFRFRPEEHTKADTVVVLIGETHRQQEFSPVFDQYAAGFPELYRFSDMISPSGSTLDAVPVILSRKKGTDTRGFFPERSLFSLFKEAGYTTYFLHYVEMYADNHLNSVYSEADRFIKYTRKVTPTSDEDILPALDAVLSEPGKKKLIVIKMVGCHVNFIDRYPSGLSFFQHALQEFQQRTKEREMHHYRKAIAYSAGIVAKIMNKTESRSEPSLLFFSSDHGICIFDKGIFHVPFNCRNAFHIPTMILLNPALSAMTPQPVKDNLKCNRDKPLTEEYDFETIASLAGIVHPTADRKYDLTKRCVPKGGKRVVFTERERVFYEDL